jgi:ribosomal protein S12 methylthiotransferase accessory factor
MSSGSEPTANAGDPAALARLMFGRKTGLFNLMQLRPSEPAELSVAHVNVRTANYAVIPEGGRILTTGGSDFGVRGAYSCAVYESIERYCAAFADHHQMILAKPDGSDGFIDHRRLPLFSDSQYSRPDWPFRRFSDESEIYWVEGRSLHTGRRRYVPSVLVFIPYRAHSPAECLGPCTSTGMACGSSWARVCSSGLLEVCERDAFMIAWLNRLSMPRLRVAPYSALGREVARTLAGKNAEVTFIDLTNDFAVPTVLAVLRSRRRGQPLVTLGMAARLTCAAAARKALLEALAEAGRLRRVLAQPGPPWQPAPDFSNVVDFEWHSLVYADPRYQGELEFLTASETERPIEETAEIRATSPEAALSSVLERVARAGEEATVVPLTTREVAETGLHVVKVLVPGAVPLFPDHRYPMLAHPRLYEVPMRIGMRSRAATTSELNLAVPHPFA